MDGQAVECVGLTRRFGARAAVSDLEFSVPRGSVFGFLGPNGAGKTTTVRMMIGMLRPTAGSIRVLGLDPIAEGDAVRFRCGVVLDNVGLYDRLSALQNLQFAARVARLGAAKAEHRIEEELHRVGLWERCYDRVAGFSKGMRLDWLTRAVLVFGAIAVALALLGLRLFRREMLVFYLRD